MKNNIKRKVSVVLRSRLLYITIISIAIFVANGIMSSYGGGGLPPGTGKDGVPAPTVTPGGVFADVPSNHWAHADIQYLAERGIITGFPGRLFKGAQPLDRFSAATLVARTVRYVQQHRPHNVIPADFGVLRNDFEVLRNLVLNVADHISVMQREIERLRAGAGTLEGRIARNEAQLAVLTQQLQAIEVQQPAVQDEELAQRVQISLIVGATGIIVGIVGIVLAFMMP
jgi:hypothetical protein